MLTELLNFDGKNFEIASDIDAEQEDKGLKNELRKLIAEQFDDFDLGNDDDRDDVSEISMCDQEVDSNSDRNTDDISSILDAGKLSLLEGAIQRFGEELSCPSDNVISDSNNMTSPRCDIFSDIELPTSNANNGPMELQDCTRTMHHPSTELSADYAMFPLRSRLEEAYHLEQNPKPHLHMQHLSVQNNQTIDWDLSLPGEVGNALIMSLQNDHKFTTSNAPGPQHNGKACIEETLAQTTSFAPTNSASFTPILTSWSPSINQPSSVSTYHQNHQSSNNSNESPNARHSHPRTSNGASGQEFSSNHKESVHLGSETCDSKSYNQHDLPPNEHDLHQQRATDLDRRQMLYEVRGRQLQELQEEIGQLKEEVARQKRLANHRATLAESEKKAIQSKLSFSEGTVKTLEKELSENQQELAQFKQKLDDAERSKNKLNEELVALRSTNESLSNQLVELTTGDAVRRVEEREAQLTEALERRFSSQTEEVRSELQSTLKKLDDRDNEIANLQRQLEMSKSDALKSQQEHNDAIKQANKRLEQAQLHCQQLASSSLCSEVSNLRQKVISLETAAKISDDVNRILQEELQDLRDQVSVYENVLKLDNISMCDENPDSADASPREVKDTEHQEPGNHYSPNRCVTFAEESRPTLVRPASAFERQPNSIDSHHRLFCDDHNRCLDEIGTKTDTGVFSTCDQDLFRSMTRRGILTSTPAATSAGGGGGGGGTGHPIMIKLRNELERCLRNYKIKRQQVTKLHETVFNTRCQLHQAKEQAENAEKMADSLKERVVSLERELTSVRESSDSPNPRELLLSGQIERLKTDYAQLEEELKVTRNRLQSALGAEARALEAEKAATERLNASSAERDAAVDRARAVCEAHYTAMRRRLELDFANEKEADSRRSEEKVAQLHRQLADCERELQRVNKLFQDAQASTQQAVEAALVEAMQEREAERMRFWIEELPQQIEAARNAWVREAAQTKHHHESKHPCVNSIVQTDPVKSCTVDKSCATDECLPIDKIKQTHSVHVQTDHSKLAHPNDWLDLESESSIQDNSNSLNPAKQYPHLSLMLPERTVYYLMTHLLETQTFSLAKIEKQLCHYLANVHRDAIHKVWVLIRSEMKRLIAENKLQTIIQLPVEPPSAVSSPDTKANQPVHMQLQIDDMNEDAMVTQWQHLILTLIQNMIKAVLNLRQSPTEHDPTPPMGTASYSKTLDKIKGDVLQYVATCQTRAALTLQHELAHLHRRTCKQFRSELRRAICHWNTNYPVDESALGTTSRAGTNMSKNPFNLLTLFQLIDQVYTTMESKFKTDDLTPFHDTSESNQPCTHVQPVPSCPNPTPVDCGLTNQSAPIRTLEITSPTCEISPRATCSDLQLDTSSRTGHSSEHTRAQTERVEVVDTVRTPILQNAHSKVMSTNCSVLGTKPIPAPRSARSSHQRPSQEIPVNPFIPLSCTTSESSSHSKPVHKELFQLFEQYQLKLDPNPTATKE